MTLPHAVILLGGVVLALAVAVFLLHGGDYE